MPQEKSKNVSLEIKYSDSIERAADTFGSHEGVTRGRIVKWLQQFDSPTQAVAVKVLKEIQFYMATNIRSMAKDLIRMAYAEFPKTSKTRMYFVPIGSAGSGSHMVARHIKGMREFHNINVVDLIDLNTISPDNVDLIVFIDDFSGTGNAIAEWWQKIEPLVLPIEAVNVVGVLVLHYRAIGRLETIFDTVLHVTMLDKSHDVFDASCSLFDEEEKGIILAACEATKCKPDLVRGYGSCGLLVVFRHGCPNNSLPILWYNSSGWVNLFERRTA